MSCKLNSKSIQIWLNRGEVELNTLNEKIICKDTSVQFISLSIHVVGGGGLGGCCVIVID